MAQCVCVNRRTSYHNCERAQCPFVGATDDSDASQHRKGGEGAGERASYLNTHKNHDDQ